MQTRVQSNFVFWYYCIDSGRSRRLAESFNCCCCELLTRSWKTCLRLLHTLLFSCPIVYPHLREELIEEERAFSSNVSHSPSFDLSNSPSHRKVGGEDQGV